MNKILKRILLTVLTALVAVGAFFGVKAYRKSGKKAKAVQVAMINSGYFEDPLSTYGFVYDSDSQSVYPESTQIISEVYVAEGQEVRAGDALMAYDMSSQELTLAMKELSVQKLQNDLNNAWNELTMLQNAKPFVPQPEPEPEPEPVPQEPDKPEKVKEKDAWNYLDKDSLDDYYNVPSEDEKEAKLGSLKNPYKYLVTADGMVYGSFFKTIKEKYPKATYFQIDISLDDTAAGKNICQWLFRSDYLKEDYDDTHAWFVMTHDDATGRGSAVMNEDIGSWTDPLIPEFIPTPSQPVVPAGPSSYDGIYTAEELARMVLSAQRTVRDLDLALRKAQLELQIMREEMQDGVVYAKKDGIVTIVSDPSAPPQDGSPFLRVSSGSGTTIRGSVSELLLDQIVPGKTVTAMSWEDGSVYEGEVVSVDNYPSTSNMYSSGNPNASYYSFTAYLPETGSLRSGQYLQLSFASDPSAAMGIFIENAFIRSDGAGSYVMKDDGGVLKKQYVSCGKTYWGQVTEIKEGLSMSDYITFPYGDGAEEGVHTELTDGGMEVFW